MNGYELGELARSAHNPRLGVLYMSGYTEDAMPRNPADRHEGILLHKPLSQVRLLEALHRTLRHER